MTMQARVIAAWLVLGAFLVTAAGSMYLGYQWADASWTKREAKWMKAANDERIAQERSAGRLAAEVERLKNRPAKVKVVTQEVVRHVVADAECASLPDTYRWLWNIDPDLDPPPGTARVGDEVVSGLASLAR